MTAAQRRSSAAIGFGDDFVVGHGLGDASVHVLFVMRFRRADEVDTSENVSRTLSALSSPLLLGTNTISDTCSGHVDAVQHLDSVRTAEG